MKTKTLGRTGLEVTIVGLGGGFLGGKNPMSHPGELDEETGIRTVVAALEGGCNWVDTAPLYGNLQSEIIIGHALRERPDLAGRCSVTTKVGRLEEGRDYSRDAILRSVEASQERLGVERFDVLFIHDAMEIPPEQVLGKGGALEALRKLQDESIVRFVGSAANDPETNAFYIETGEFDAAVVAQSWSLLNQTAQKRILPAAERYDVGIIGATSLERGLLARGPEPGWEFMGRRPSPACVDYLQGIIRLCEAYGISLLAASLQWCTRHPQVATTIPGARIPEEAAANAAAGEMEIPEAFWSDLGPLIRHWELGVDL